MYQLLKPGLTLELPTLGKQCQLTGFIGGGGEGEVYRARLDTTDLAIKWYFDFRATAEQRSILQRLIDQRAPNASFLWPISLAETGASGAVGFGYAMPLRPPNFKSLRDLMSGTIDPTFRVLATAGYELATAFRRVHAQGCTYCDISFGNAFFDPKTGAVLICDNDNVSIAGQRIGVLGTPDFMAPEIVRGQADPSIQTDLFSLSVLLFYLFHIHHPLCGYRMSQFRCWDLPARNKVFGHEPVFIFHPTDTSNRALDRQQDPTGECGANALTYWPLYPQFLRDLFTQAFVAGLQPDHRVRESQWQLAFIQLRDLIFYCGAPKCGAENFFDSKAKAGPKCWQCHQPLTPPFRLELPRGTVLLNHDTRLFPHHLRAGSDYVFDVPVAEVARHPKDPALWGLRNLGETTWTAVRPDQSTVDVPPGKALPLSPGLDVNFGAVRGRIHYG